MKLKTKKSKKIYLIISGLFCGFLNGFFGAGGGTVVVPALSKAGLSEKEAHATSIAVILPVTLVSLIFYLVRGDVHIPDALPFVYSGVVGAVVGAAFLKKISAVWLKRIFGAVILFAAVRMFLR